MTERQLKYYEAGIQMARQSHKFIPMCRCNEAMELMREDHSPVCAESTAKVEAYNSGMVFELSRLSRLGYAIG